ncbi:MAG: hypothetical protein U0796_21660 [Gemmatales bacterium]
MPELNEPVLPDGTMQPPVSEPMVETVPDPLGSEVPDPLPPLETPPVVEAPVFPVLEQASSSPWPTDSPRLTAPTSGGPRRLPLSVWVLSLLVPYAIGSTIGLAYLFQQQQRSKQPHILESIPDQGLYEDFFEARRKEVMPPLSKAGEKQSAGKIIPPTEPILPEMQPIKMGETRRVGMLSVTPLAMTKQELKYLYRANSNGVPAGEGLVLVLKVKNEGPLIFHPDDPTFNRSISSDSKAPIYTFLEQGRDRYYGVVNDPSQEQLHLPVMGALIPGETGSMHVVASRTSDGKLAADLKPGTTGVWRVQLRKGKEEITLSTGRKRSVWVTTVVPVEVKVMEKTETPRGVGGLHAMPGVSGK